MRVMIAEDSGLLRDMLAETLTARGMDVTGLAGTREDIVDLTDKAPPDVVLLDVRMPPAQLDEGLRAAEEIRAAHPEVGLLVLSHYAETSYAVRLLETVDRGVGYLVKDRVQDAGVLIDAIERVGAGEVVIDPLVVQRVMSRPRTVDPLGRLSPSEKSVLSLVAEGRSNGAIAGELGYSVKTVEKRVTSISQKLDLPPAGNEGRFGVNVRVLAVLTYLRSAAG